MKQQATELDCGSDCGCGHDEPKLGTGWWRLLVFTIAQNWPNRPRQQNTAFDTHHSFIHRFLPLPRAGRPIVPSPPVLWGRGHRTIGAVPVVPGDSSWGTGPRTSSLALFAPLQSSLAGRQGCSGIQVGHEDWLRYSVDPMNNGTSEGVPVMRYTVHPGEATSAVGIGHEAHPAPN